MYKSCKRLYKRKYLLIILVLIFGLSVGYALINRTLSITGNSEVKQNVWDIHFENIQVTMGSVTAVKEAIIENDLSIDFSVNLDLPGDFYEFTVDVVNEGTIDAMLDSIVKNPELIEQQAEYLNYIIEYQNGESIQLKQLVKSNDFVRLKVRVEYRKDINLEDLPTTAEILNLGFSVNYVQADNTGIDVKDNGAWKIEANGSLDDIGTIVTIGSEQFYTIGNDGDNIKLLSMYNLYIGNECTDYSSSSCIAYGNEITGMQNENMKGYIENQTLRMGTTAFSSDEQKGINYSSYNGSIVEKYVNNYKKLLEVNFDIDIIEARLITKEELISDDIGCNENLKSCSDAPDWIYSTTYWTASTFDSSTLWRVLSEGKLHLDLYYRNYGSGVRPLIILSKSVIKKESIAD